MKAIILAGGYGTRLSEETTLRPKPMVEVGGRPIIWHIIKIYESHGVTDFIVCCGYKGWMLKEYFANYALYASDVTFDMKRDAVELHRRGQEQWRVTLVDTGDHTMTGGRIKRVRDHLEDDTFLLTYGDGVADVDIRASIALHREQQALATMTVVQPPGRFGALVLEPEQTFVSRFHEKPRGGGDSAWVNGGFFVLEPAVLDYIDGDETVWEREPLERLAHHGKLAAYRHEGFWQPMDTLRDRMVLESLWEGGNAPWKRW